MSVLSQPSTDIPDRILAVPAIPYTVTGKKCEVPVKRLLRGEPAELVIARESLRNPDSLDSLLQVVAPCP